MCGLERPRDFDRRGRVVEFIQTAFDVATYLDNRGWVLLSQSDGGGDLFFLYLNRTLLNGLHFGNIILLSAVSGRESYLLSCTKGDFSPTN